MQQNSPATSVVIPAAGYGLRMGTETRKPYLKLGDKEILFLTLEKFQELENLSEIILVVNPGDLDRIIKEWQTPLRSLNVKHIIPGGKTRAHSVNNALAVLNPATDVVLIHDAVRPFIDKEVVEKVVSESYLHGAAIAAVKVKDTVKQVENNIITATVPREPLWLAQTPQGFKKEIILEAYSRTDLNDASITDDSFLVESMGLNVRIVPDSFMNFKITTPDDLELAKKIITNN